MSQELLIVWHFILKDIRSIKNYVLNIILQGPVQDGGLNRIQISTQNNAIAKYFTSKLSESYLYILLIVQRLGGIRSVMKDSIGWILKQNNNQLGSANHTKRTIRGLQTHFAIVINLKSQ